MRRTPLFAVLFADLFAAPAGAAVPHVVQPGETLWSIAAANNLTTRTVAAFNGLSESSQVVLGSTIMVPSTVEGYASLQKAGLVVRRRAAPRRAGRRRCRGARRRRPPHPPRWAATPCARVTRSPASPPAPACRVNAIAADERPQPERRAARRHRDQAADRRPRARPRRAARAGREGRPGRRARAHRYARRRRRRPVRRLRPRRLPLAGDRDRLAGERLQQLDGLHRQRPRRHAGHARHVGLRAAEPGLRAS